MSIYTFLSSKGRVIFSSGSPFPPVEYNGKTYNPGQGNNAYIFPGVALGVITTGTHHISDDMFLIAARELANFVDQSDLDRGSLYPSLNAVREVSMRIAESVTKCAYDKGAFSGIYMYLYCFCIDVNMVLSLQLGLASTYPEPSDKRKWLEDQLYNFNYQSSMPVTWPWPRMPYVKTRPLEPTILFSDSSD